MSKEMMHISEFIEEYGITRSRFYIEVKKYPWLVTKLGRRVHVMKRNADKWMDAIEVANISALSTGIFA